MLTVNPFTLVLTVIRHVVCDGSSHLSGNVEPGLHFGGSSGKGVTLLSVNVYACLMLC